MDSGAASAASRPSAGGRLKVLFILSLALNLLIIGALAGAFFMGPRHGHWHGGSRGEDYGLLSFARQLPADRRAVISRDLRGGRESRRVLWDKIHEARAAAAEVLVAEPFDRGKVKAAFDRIGAAESTLRDAGVDVFLDTAEQLSPEERKQLRAWWEKKRSRFKFPWSRRRDKNAD